MSESEYKVLIVPCKVCGKEFEFRRPMEFYKMATADGSAEFSDTWPDCRKDNRAQTN
jgi:hypothetical protein